MTKKTDNEELSVQAKNFKHIKAKSDVEPDNDSMTEMDEIILAAELTGAFKGVEVSKALQVAAQAGILDEIHKRKLHKRLGFTDFREYVKKKLGVSGSLVYDILQQRERLGATVFEALLNCNLDYKVIKALASPEVNATPTEDKTPVLKIKDEVIEITPENRGVIQALVKDVMAELKNAEKDTKEEMKRRFELEKKVKELEQPKVIEIPNYNEYKLKGDAIVQKFDAIITELFDHQKPALVEPKAWSLYYRTLVEINAAWEEQWEYLSNRSLMAKEV